MKNMKRALLALALIAQSTLLAPVHSQGRMSNVCRTPYGACHLPSAAPVGSPCWCGTPYGPVAGSVG